MADLMAKTVKTPAGTAPVIPVLLIALGGYLTWFGVHYWRSDTRWPTDPLKAVLTGKEIPVADTSGSRAAIKGVVESAKNQSSALGPAAIGAAGGDSSGAGGDKIASQSLEYIGQGYVFGAPANRPGNWDCSSFVSYVLGHDLGYPLPGGKWGGPGMPPHSHGPTTHNYMLFGQPVSAVAVRKGDIVVNAQHMGIMVAEGSYMSAKTPARGTGLGLVKDFPGGPPVYRRVA
jgi:cell wall-associated NlpC family hydrolase